MGSYPAEVSSQIAITCPYLSLIARTARVSCRPKVLFLSGIYRGLEIYRYLRSKILLYDIKERLDFDPKLIAFLLAHQLVFSTSHVCA